MIYIKVLISIILVALILTDCKRDQSGSEQIPNIVFIIADDIGWRDLGPYDNKAASTPNIDRIANEGIKFNNAYLTTSSCSPSRSSIISGRYPHNTGVPEFSYTGALPAKIPIFPELLKREGYYTAQAGKWHMGDHARRGFDKIHDKDLGWGGEKKWVSTLRERPKNKPFFMWFASTDPHRDWDSANQFGGTNDPNNIDPPPYLANTSSTRRDLAEYYDEITRFDSYVGKVEEELERQGVLDNTILIIISDNGSAFPRAKTRLYDSGIKTPLIIKWGKGIDKAGAVSNSMISVIDFAPTLLDIAGAEIAPSFQGKSFAKLLKHPKTKFRTYIFAEHNWHGFEAYERMVRTKNHMYILNERPALSNPPPSDAIKSASFEDLKALRDLGRLTPAQNDVFVTPRPYEELYDVTNDPWQMINIASLPKYESNLKKLRNIMNQWQQETDDSVPDILTKDWYSRKTGEILPGINFKAIKQNQGKGNSRYPYNYGYRGETPGTENAMTTTNGGPF